MSNLMRMSTKSSMPYKQKLKTGAQAGFTLIELMIVITIIGILSAIAIPAYNGYVKKAMATGCMAEAKGYSNRVFTVLYDQHMDTIPAPSNSRYCASITDATGWTIEDATTIVATVVDQPYIIIHCDMTKGATCAFQ